MRPSATFNAWSPMLGGTSADLDAVARSIAIILDVPVILIGALVDDRHVFLGVHGVSKDAADDVSPLCLEVVTLNRPVLMQDARRHLAIGAHDELGTKLVSYMGLPIARRDGVCLGAISAFREAQHEWGGHDLVLLRGFVDLLAAILSERQDEES